MSKKTLVNFFQNLTLIALTVTAVLLIMQFPMLDGTLSGKMRDFLAAPQAASRTDVDLSAVITTVHFMVTNDREYGRHAQINVSTGGADFQRMSHLLREAIGSADAGRAATEVEFRKALDSPGIYVDLIAPLPLTLVAEWLGETLGAEDEIRALAVTTMRETATIYFLRGDNSISCRQSALSSAAVREVAAMFPPNGGQFAFESDHPSLASYALLVRSAPTLNHVEAAIPAGYSAYNLLTALDFNAHTNSRYIESSGTEVIMQSPRTLRIGTDGSVRYSSDGEVTDELYKIAYTGERPNVLDVVRGSCALAQTLCAGTDASPLSLESVKRTVDGWEVTFCYRIGGVRVRLNHNSAALRLLIRNDTITSFQYYCRAYTVTEKDDSLLPPAIATAIASTHEGAEPVLAYVDQGAAELSAHWFAQ